MGRGLALWWEMLMDFYTNLKFFINLYWCEQFLKQCGFKQLLVQNELIFNLWMKWMKPWMNIEIFFRDTKILVKTGKITCLIRHITRNFLGQGFLKIRAQQIFNQQHTKERPHWEKFLRFFSYIKTAFFPQNQGTFL